jgi:6-phosphogluconolactonase
MSTEPEVRIFDSVEELFRKASEKFCEIGLEAIADHGRFTVALSGGSTPKRLHSQLVAAFASKLPWDKVFFFFGDERHVPPDFPESNFRMAKETLLSKLLIPTNNVFRIPGEIPDANQAAGVYDVMFLAEGDGKADIVRTALREPSANLPCQGVRPLHGELMWYLDKAAGARL